MNKIYLYGIILLGIIGIVSASGSLQEYASNNPCHCLLFNSTSNTAIWTLENTYNSPITFSITKPNLANVTINLSAMNGTIPANSIYPITVSISLSSFTNSSGYLIAYNESGVLVAYPNTTTTSGSATITTGVAKNIKVEFPKPASTTTIPPSTGGSAGSGSPGGESSPKPTIVKGVNGAYLISNVTQYATFNLIINGTKLSFMDNFISPNETGITVSDPTMYTLSLNEPIVIYANSAMEIFAELLNISYTPLQHMARLGVYSKAVSPANTTIITTTVPPSNTTTATTTLVGNTISPGNTTTTPPANVTTGRSQSSNSGIGTIVLVILIIIAVAIVIWYFFIKNAAPAKKDN
jgi:hypothetical protein